MTDGRAEFARVRIEDLRSGEPDRWLAPGAGVFWTYVDRPEDAGVWPWPEAARRASEYRRGHAWRGRAAELEPAPAP